MTDSDNITTSFYRIQQRIDDYCREAGRKPDTIKLLAVSKTHSAQRVRDLHNHTSHTLFGENYADELIKKAASLADLPLSWHYIGRLQSNKIKALVQAADCIQSVESDKHLRLIARHAAALGRSPYPVYIAVNAAGEVQKSGVSISQAISLAKRASENYPEIKVCGMMTVPPAEFQDATHTEVPNLYRELQAASRSLGDGDLSLGMTGDLRLAVLAGSTMVRVGTAIFGERHYEREPSTQD